MYLRGERFAVRHPVGVKSDFFFVFIPIVRVNDIQISVENLFAAALSPAHSLCINFPAFFSRYNISNLSDIGHPLTRRAGADNTDIRIFKKLLFRKGDNENAFAYAES